MRPVDPKNPTPKRQQLRVLLIDDNENEFLLTQRTLQLINQSEYNFHLDWEPNGDRAQQLMIDNQYDLYLLDYHIGPWNGIDLLRAAYQMCENPIIMLTEHDQYDVDKEAMTLGAADFVLKRDLSPSLIERVIRYANQRKAMLDALKVQAFRDELTHLCNRREFNIQLQNQIAAADRHNHPLCLCLSDIDHFKSVNDRYGHSAGDAALIHFSRIIRNTIRTEDIAARFGGDEFAIIFPLIHIDGAEASVERIRHSVQSEAVRHDHERFHIQGSFGIACHQPGMTEQQLLDAADEALYQAKALGRNRSHVQRQPRQMPQARHQKAQ